MEVKPVWHCKSMLALESLSGVNTFQSTVIFRKHEHDETMGVSVVQTGVVGGWRFDCFVRP